VGIAGKYDGNDIPDGSLVPLYGLANPTLTPLTGPILAACRGSLAAGEIAPEVQPPPDLCPPDLCLTQNRRRICA
jgi:hypothetical protein